MAHSERARSRSRLFSLTARLQRREERRARAEPASAHSDDGCPICMAARTGGDVWSFFPGIDGSAPAIPEAFLVSAAREAMAQRRPKADKTISFIDYGTPTPHGDVVRSSFTVDGAGRVYWSSPTEERFILEIAADASTS